jgi:hypothetical protein
MRISELMKEGLRIAREQRSFWLFGFFVGAAASNQGGGGGDGAPVGVPGPGGDPGLGALFLIVVLVILLVAGVVMYFISQGALIEGVTRLRRGAQLSVREGFRRGWSHAGVIFKITLIYYAANIASLLVLAVPALLGLRLGSIFAALVLAIPAVIVAVPWLVTLYIWRAFGMRIAVLENRSALDAVGKARLFLHGRLGQGLRALVAAFLGTLLIALVGALVLVPVALLMVFTLAPAAGPLAFVVIALVLLPAVVVVVSVLGTYQSSVWTLGYLAQVAR